VLSEEYGTTEDGELTQHPFKDPEGDRPIDDLGRRLKSQQFPSLDTPFKRRGPQTHELEGLAGGNPVEVRILSSDH